MALIHIEFNPHIEFKPDISLIKANRTITPQINVGGNVDLHQLGHTRVMNGQGANYLSHAQPRNPEYILALGDGTYKSFSSQKDLKDFAETLDPKTYRLLGEESE